VQAVTGAVRWENRRISQSQAEDAAAARIVGGGGERFLNAPNLVSIGRMVSGPVIGWSVFSLTVICDYLLLELHSSCS
jgi:cardiolipin synthase (CMP-forming)